MTDERSDTTVLMERLAFPDCPRWHEGRLWFSDFYSHRVCSVSLEGDLRTELEGGLDKMVVFGVHTRAAELLRGYLLDHNIQCVLVNGQTPRRIVKPTCGRSRKTRACGC